jgi:hypothetical protein
MEIVRLIRGDDRVRFNLDQHCRRDQTLDLNHRRGWTDRAEEFAVRSHRLLPVVDGDTYIQVRTTSCNVAPVCRRAAA